MVPPISRPQDASAIGEPKTFDDDAFRGKKLSRLVYYPVMHPGLRRARCTLLGPLGLIDQAILPTR